MGMPTAKSSGLLSVGQVLWTGHHTLNSVQAFGNGTDAATITIYDSVTAGGKILARLALPVGQTSAFISFDRALYAEIGLFVSIIGTGAEAIVGFGAS